MSGGGGTPVLITTERCDRHSHFFRVWLLHAVGQWDVAHVGRSHEAGAVRRPCTTDGWHAHRDRVAQATDANEIMTQTLR